MAVEEVCLKLPPRQQQNSGLRQAVYLDGTAPPEPNITGEEVRALKDFREDQSRVILTADMGMVIVVLDTHDYINKAQDLLLQKDTYRPIMVDPTTKHKNNSLTCSEL